MAEYVVHEHDTASGGGSSFLIGVILLAIVVLFLLFYGVPILRNLGTASAPQVNVPGQVDVNVHQK